MVNRKQVRTLGPYYQQLVGSDTWKHLKEFLQGRVDAAERAKPPLDAEQHQIFIQLGEFQGKRLAYQDVINHVENIAKQYSRMSTEQEN